MAMQIIEATKTEITEAIKAEIIAMQIIEAIKAEIIAIVESHRGKPDDFSVRERVFTKQVIVTIVMMVV